MSIYVLHNGYSDNPLYVHLYLIINGILGVILVFAFFRKYQNAFREET